jgi:hypothetical protein
LIQAHRVDDGFMSTEVLQKLIRYLKKRTFCTFPLTWPSGKRNFLILSGEALAKVNSDFERAKARTFQKEMNKKHFFPSFFSYSFLVIREHAVTLSGRNVPQPHGCISSTADELRIRSLSLQIPNGRGVAFKTHDLQKGLK